MNMSASERQQRWRERNRPTVLVEIDREVIKGRMRDLGLKRYWVADQLGVHDTTVKRWLSGNIKRISVEHFNRFMDLLEAAAK